MKTEDRYLDVSEVQRARRRRSQIPRDTCIFCPKPAHIQVQTQGGKKKWMCFTDFCVWVEDEGSVHDFAVLSGDPGNLTQRTVSIERAGPDAIFAYLSIESDELLARQTEILQKIGPIVDEVQDPNRFHITLLYSDNASNSSVDRMLDSLSLPDAIEFVLGPLMILGEDRPALVWRVIPSPELLDLQDQIYRRALIEGLDVSPFSIPFEYKPHVTVAYLTEEPPSMLSNMPLKLKSDRLIFSRGEFDSVATFRLNGISAIESRFGHGPSVVVDKEELIDLLKNGEIITGPLRRRVVLGRDKVTVIERDGGMPAAEATQNMENSAATDTREGIGMRETEGKGPNQGKRFGKPHHEELFDIKDVESLADFKELRETKDEWPGDASAVMDEVLDHIRRQEEPPNEDDDAEIEQFKADVLKWQIEEELDRIFNEPNSYLVLNTPPEDLLTMSDQEIDALMREHAAENVEEVSEQDARKALATFGESDTGPPVAFSLGLNEDEEIVAVYKLTAWGPRIDIENYLIENLEQAHRSTDEISRDIRGIDWMSLDFLLVKEYGKGYGSQMATDALGRAAEQNMGLFLHYPNDTESFYRQFDPIMSEDQNIAIYTPDMAADLSMELFETEFEERSWVERESLSRVMAAIAGDEKGISVMEPIDGVMAIPVIEDFLRRPWLKKIAGDQAAVISGEDQKVLDAREQGFRRDQVGTLENEFASTVNASPQRSVLADLFEKIATIFRHGDHVDQAGVKGQRGGSAEGFTHQGASSEAKKKAKGEKTKAEAGEREGPGAGGRPVKAVSQLGEVKTENIPERWQETYDEVIAGLSPDQIKEIETARNAIVNGTQTIDQHIDEDGNLTTARQKLHDEIVESHFENVADVPEGEQPRIIVTGGLPGAGKSSVMDELAEDTEGYVIINSDTIKASFPEYVGWNAALLHEEADLPLERIMERAVAEGRSIVFDSTMKSTDKMVNIINAMEDAGYQTDVVFVDVPMEVALTRAVDRFDRGGGVGGGGRFVDPAYIVTHNGKNLGTLDAIKPIANSWQHWDNNVPRGESPILLDEGGRVATEEEEEQLIGSPEVAGEAAGEATAERMWAVMRTIYPWLERHGDHEGQEGRPGSQGGSAPGFTHTGAGDGVGGRRSIPVSEHRPIIQGLRDMDTKITTLRRELGERKQPGDMMLERELQNSRLALQASRAEQRAGREIDASPDAIREQVHRSVNLYKDWAEREGIDLTIEANQPRDWDLLVEIADDQQVQVDRNTRAFRGMMETRNPNEDTGGLIDSYVAHAGGDEWREGQIVRALDEARARTFGNTAFTDVEGNLITDVPESGIGFLSSDLKATLDDPLFTDQTREAVARSWLERAQTEGTFESFEAKTLSEQQGMSAEAVAYTMFAVSSDDQWVPSDYENVDIAQTLNDGWQRSTQTKDGILLTEIISEEFGGSVIPRENNTGFTPISEELRAAAADPDSFGLSSVEAVDIRLEIEELEEENEEFLSYMDDEGRRAEATAFVRDTYDNTQAELADWGLQPGDTIRLYRGMGGASEPWNEEGVFGATEVDMWAVSSWTTDLQTASNFAGGLGSDGAIVAADIPVEQILGTWTTSLPAKYEQEYLVMGQDGVDAMVYSPNEGEFTIRSLSDPKRVIEIPTTVEERSMIARQEELGRLHVDERSGNWLHNLLKPKTRDESDLEKTRARAEGTARVERHGDHVDQSGIEGHRGGSEPGFHHEGAEGAEQTARQRRAAARRMVYEAGQNFEAAQMTNEQLKFQAASNILNPQWEGADPDFLVNRQIDQTNAVAGIIEKAGEGTSHESEFREFAESQRDLIKEFEETGDQEILFTVIAENALMRERLNEIGVMNTLSSNDDNRYGVLLDAAETPDPDKMFSDMQIQNNKMQLTRWDMNIDAYETSIREMEDERDAAGWRTDVLEAGSRAQEIMADNSVSINEDRQLFLGDIRETELTLDDLDAEFKSWHDTGDEAWEKKNELSEQLVGASPQEEARITAEWKEQNDLWGESIKERERIKAEREAIAEQGRAAFLETYGEEPEGDDFGIVFMRVDEEAFPVEPDPLVAAEQEFEGVGRGKVDSQIEEAERWLEQVVNPRLMDSVLPPEVTLDDDGRADYRNGEISINEYDDVATYLHEWGHHIEYEPGNHEAAIAFALDRQGDEELRPLARIEIERGDIETVSDSAYGTYEIGVRDKWDDVYTGKQYPAFSGATIRSTEVVSMGVQKLYEDPAGFARSDPEYFDFMVSMLNGDFVDILEEEG